jgi:hypothetical protein
MWKPYDAVCTIWSWVGATGLVRELGSHAYIWFYSGTLTVSATLGASIAKQRH